MWRDIWSAAQMIVILQQEVRDHIVKNVLLKGSRKLSKTFRDAAHQLRLVESIE